MRPPTKRNIIAVMIIALVLLSCSLPKGIGGKIKQVAETTVPIHEETPTTVQAIATVVDIVQGTAESSIQSGVENLATSIIGIDTSMLDNFRTSFSVISNGTDVSGSTIDQVIEIKTELNKAETMNHSQIHLNSTGSNDQTGDMELFAKEGQSYMIYADNPDVPCLSVGSSSDLFNGLYLNPEDFLKSIETGELLESKVTINDIITDHYRIKNSILNIGNAIFKSGEIWIARDGGYIVRSLGQADGDISDGTHSGIGTIEWVYNLYDVGKVTDIVIPESCLNQQETSDIVPVPENAVNKQSFGGIISFDSPDKPEQVGEYYRQTLPTQGWTIKQDNLLAGVVMMSAVKGEESLDLVITQGSTSGSSVIITTIGMP